MPDEARIPARTPADRRPARRWPIVLAGGVLLVTYLFGRPSGLLGWDNHPCVVWDTALRPLALGDTVRITVGRTENTDCMRKKGDQGTWIGSDPEVATITPDGLVSGHAPGVFRAAGVVEGDTLRIEGFVLPRDYVVRIEPESVEVAVGDSVAFSVRAIGSDGRVHSGIPFWINTPSERLMIDRRAEPLGPQEQLLTREQFKNLDTVAAMLHAERAGTTVIIGKIGKREARARLVVAPKRAGVEGTP